MSISNAHETALLDYTFNTLYPTSYIKLHIGDPGEAATSNAAAETTRQAVTFGAATGSGTIANDSAVNWTNYPSAESITHISIWSASTAGTAIWIGPASAGPYTPGVGNTLQIAIGALVVSLD